VNKAAKGGPNRLPPNRPAVAAGASAGWPINSGPRIANLGLTMSVSDRVDGAPTYGVAPTTIGRLPSPFAENAAA
jgi:hypothetical protein